ncbi:MAG: SusC/RagA family TonB-linked outer membrane protein [Muribaculaceae bacterium]
MTSKFYHGIHLLRNLLLASFLLIFGFAGAQAQTVASGIVVDESGETLIGVTVMEKGTNNATATDFEGRYTLKVSSSKATLDFSYVGYNPASAKAEKNARVVMKSKTELLEEVVVVAYGVQKKATVTGSMASVNDEEIRKSSAPTVAAAIAGKIPGLTAIQTNGEPGNDDVNMYLRGAATTNGTNPLILVDGVPRESIREIDSNEIETLSVLKDASATAVFGVRGANGVILITTKRGQAGKMTVRPSVLYSIQSFNSSAKHMDSYTHALLSNEAKINEGASPEFTDDQIDKFKSWVDGRGGPDNAVDRYWYPNTDWQSLMFRDHASMVRTNVDVSGGTDRLQYFVNVGYLYQGGMFKTEDTKTLGYNPNSSLNRYNFRSNIDYKFSQYVKASVDVSSFIEKFNRTAGDWPTIWAGSIAHRPTAVGPVTSDEYQFYNGAEFNQIKSGGIVKDNTTSINSAYGYLNRQGYQLITRSGVNAIAQLNIDLSFLTKGLSLKGLVSFESRGNSTVSGTRSFVQYEYTRKSTEEHPEPYFILSGDDDEDGRLSVSRGNTSNWFLNAQIQANYARTFGKHDVSGMVLFQRDIKEVSEGSGYSSPYLPFNVIGLSARATYAFDSRYMAEVNMGYNGSEQFAKGHRFGFFPAFSAGWLVSNEPFLKEYQQTLSNLKFRASYGKVGNDRLGSSRFLYIDDIQQSGSTYWNQAIPSLGGGGKISESMLGNNKLSWETAWKQNYGVDLGLFKNLNLSFDYFIEHRQDVLISRHMVPLLGGLSSSQLPRVNMGKVDNKGYEITARYTLPINKNLLIGFNGNFSYNSNKIVEYDEAPYDEEYAYRTRYTGYSIGQQWGYLIDYSYDPETGRQGNGFFNSKEDIEKSGLKYEIGTPLAGDFIYQDLNGDGKINDKDVAPIGYSSSIPKINYGFGMNVQAYGFDFSIMFQGVGKYSKYYSGWGMFEESGGGKFFTTDMHMQRWSEERYAAGETITHPRLANSQSTSHIQNDYYTMDASFIRLKNIEVGYTLPKSISGKIGASNLRIYFSADNIHTWHNLRTDYLDPEQSSILAYPITKSVNCGVSLQF